MVFMSLEIKIKLLKFLNFELNNKHFIKQGVMGSAACQLDIKPIGVGSIMKKKRRKTRTAVLSTRHQTDRETLG